jgi:hypothetical protein
MRILNWIGVECETGVSVHRIKYAIQRGRLGGFTMVNGSYVFGDEDVARIGSYFAGRKPWQRLEPSINNKNGEMN